MMQSLDRVEMERFRELVASRMGLLFDERKLDLLTDVLRTRIERRGCDRLYSYLEIVESGDAEELRALAEQLTVSETYFFRNPDQYRAFADLVLPDRARTRGSQRSLRILSAGCASGEEAYSLAILVRDHLADFGGWDLKIAGIDLCPSMIARALRARYSPWSLRETPAHVRDRHFRGDGKELALDEEIRPMVAFEVRNLVEDDPAFWCRDAFDVVFCRNVLMYLSPEAARVVVGRIAGALSEGGFLFLGHAETLRGLSQAFQLCHTHDTFYYRRRVSSEPFLEVSPQRPPASSELAPLELTDSSWVDVIQRSSERVARLSTVASQAADATEAAGSPPAGTTPLPPSPTWDLLSAVELLRQERFVDALELLGALPAESQVDLDVQLLRAVLLTNSGRHVDAEHLCKQMLASDDLNAGAHYLMALCREHDGDRQGALEHDKSSIHLDPEFAMPHLHVGLLARRSRDQQTAHRELGAALSLLAREDASRILLFGGGFSREALVELCRSELRAGGVGP